MGDHRIAPRDEPGPREPPLPVRPPDRRGPRLRGGRGNDAPARRERSRLFEAARERLGAITRCSFTERWLLGLVGGIATLLFLQEFGLPTDDYDSLAYQLPRAVEWYQQGTFLTRPAQWGEWINSYPYGWNTMFFLLVAPVGHDQLALLPNLAAWVMLGLAATASRASEAVIGRGALRPRPW